MVLLPEITIDSHEQVLARVSLYACVQSLDCGSTLYQRQHNRNTFLGPHLAATDTLGRCHPETNPYKVLAHIHLPHGYSNTHILMRVTHTLRVWSLDGGSILYRERARLDHTSMTSPRRTHLTGRDHPRITPYQSLQTPNKKIAKVMHTKTHKIHMQHSKVQRRCLCLEFSFLLYYLNLFIFSLINSIISNSRYQTLYYYTSTFISSFALISQVSKYASLSTRESTYFLKSQFRQYYQFHNFLYNYLILMVLIHFL